MQHSPCVVLQIHSAFGCCQCESGIKPCVLSVKLCDLSAFCEGLGLLLAWSTIAYVTNLSRVLDVGQAHNPGCSEAYIL